MLPAGWDGLSALSHMAKRISDSNGDWISVERIPLEQSRNRLCSYQEGALWLWQSRRGNNPLPRPDVFTVNDLARCGAKESAHIFDVSSVDPEQYRLIHRSAVGNVARRVDVLELPLRQWPFACTIKSHTENLLECIAERRPHLSLVVRVYDGLPQTYLRLLCPSGENGHDVTKIFSVVALQQHAILPRLVRHIGAVY